MPDFHGLTARAVTIATEYWPADAGPLPPINVRRVRCGRFYWRSKTITLPMWLFDSLSPLPHGYPESEREGYIRWYVAHELCHALCGKAVQHGPAFQARLHAMIGTHLYRFEATYKPKMHAAEMRRAARFDGVAA